MLQANFSLSVKHLKAQNVLFNTPLLRRKPLQNDLVLDEFVTSVKMSSYLVAIILSNFESKSKTLMSKISKRSIIVSIVLYD